MNKQKVVRIYWIDSASTSGWNEVNEKMDLRCESVGFLIKKTKDKIIIAENLSHGVNHIQYGMHMHIPMCAVKRVQYL